MEKKLRQQVEKGQLPPSAENAEKIRQLYGADARLELEALASAAGPGVACWVDTPALQNLLLWCLTADKGDMPRFVAVRNKPLLAGVVLVLAPGVGCDALDRLGRGFSPKPWPVIMPRAHCSRSAAAAASELLSVRLPRKRRRPDSPVGAKAPSVVDPNHVGRHPSGRGWRRSYVAGFQPHADELAENGYPLSGDPACEGYTDAFGDPEQAAEAAATAAAALAFRARFEAAAADTAAAFHAAAATTTFAAGHAAEPEAHAAEPEAHADADLARLLSIDCEMCLVEGDEKQLARVAVVDEAGRLLLDELVKPERPVVDYKTEYSGVTRAMLDTARLTLAEATKTVRQLIHGYSQSGRRVWAGAGRRTFLVGHSLDSDLHALRLRLPRHPDSSAAGGVLDTALLFPLRVHHRGPPAKAALRNLTVNYLGREIQQPNGAAGAPTGHSPFEDATAALDLAALKLARGAAYAVPGASWGGGFESLHDALARAGVRCAALGSAQDLASAPHHQQPSGGDGAAPAAAAASSADAATSPPSSSAARLVECEDDVAATSEAVRVARESTTPSFTWLQLRSAPAEVGELLESLRGSLPANTLVALLGTGPLPTAPAPPPAEPAPNTPSAHGGAAVLGPPFQSAPAKAATGGLVLAVALGEAAD